MYTVLYDEETELFYVSTEYACEDAEIFFFDLEKAEAYANSCNRLRKLLEQQNR